MTLGFIIVWYSEFNVPQFISFFQRSVYFISSVNACRCTRAHIRAAIANATHLTFAMPVPGKKKELYTEVFSMITCLGCTIVAEQVIQNVWLTYLFTKSYSFQGDNDHNLSPCTQNIGTNIGSLSTEIKM